MNKTIIGVVVVLVVVLGGWYIYKHNDADSSADMDMAAAPATDTGASSPAPASSGSQTTVVPVQTPAHGPQTDEFTVTGGNYFFSPKTMTVAKGDTVKITFVNSGGMHDFKIDEFNVATSRLQGGQSTVVTFVADKEGSFQYYCSVGTHRQMGMVGTLVVSAGRQ